MSRNVTRRRGQEAIAADEKGKEGTTERAEEKRKSEYMYSANGADKGVGNKKVRLADRRLRGGLM
jgi:hypothetical protein